MLSFSALLFLTGETPLTCAISRQNAYLACYFLDHGADTEKLNSEGYTPLHFATNQGSMDLYAYSSFLTVLHLHLYCVCVRSHISVTHRVNFSDWVFFIVEGRKVYTIYVQSSSFSPYTHHIMQSTTSRPFMFQCYCQFSLAKSQKFKHALVSEFCLLHQFQAIIDYVFRGLDVCLLNYNQGVTTKYL